MHTITRVPLTVKEGEAIMWCLGQIANYPDRPALSSSDPLAVLFAEGHERAEVMAAANAMFEMAYGDWLVDPTTALERSILRVCVENTTWITAYVQDLPGQVPEAKATLRNLAGKLELVGVEVNYIPAD